LQIWGASFKVRYCLLLSANERLPEFERSSLQQTRFPSKNVTGTLDTTW
jgi:hypothetical protein